MRPSVVEARGRSPDSWGGGGPSRLLLQCLARAEGRLLRSEALELELVGQTLLGECGLVEVVGGLGHGLLLPVDLDVVDREVSVLALEALEGELVGETLLGERAEGQVVLCLRDGVLLPRREAGALLLRLGLVAAGLDVLVVLREW